MRKLILVGSAISILALGQFVAARTATIQTEPRAGTAGTPFSAMLDCPGEDAGVLTLLDLQATQQFALTDYIAVDRRDETLAEGFNRVTFGVRMSSGPVARFRVAIALSDHVHGTFATPIVFDGREGALGITCRGEADVIVSGLLRQRGPEGPPGR